LTLPILLLLSTVEIPIKKVGEKKKEYLARAQGSLQGRPYTFPAIHVGANKNLNHGDTIPLSCFSISTFIPTLFYYFR
jgi:hypothetical protein